MASQWIVMVNRIPRGPLSEDEILILFSKNLISRNDLAYLVPENASEGTAEWKFLWQFPSFDRRKNENLSTNPAELTEAQRKRRTERYSQKSFQ
jgi:hypothetical protein